MAAYLLHYVDFVTDLKVLKFADARGADLYGFGLPPGRTAKVVADEASFHDRAVFSMGLLAAIYNALGPDKPLTGKFETHDAAARRTFAQLYAKFNQLELTPSQGGAAPSASQPRSLQPVEEIIEMAKTATTRVKSSRAPGVQRPITAKPAGLVSEFKQTREGTARATILKMMDGSKTPDEIALLMGGDKFDGKYVMAHAYCLHRDCAIGYEMTKDGKLLALYPRGRTYEHAIRGPGDKKTASTTRRKKNAPVEVAHEPEPESAAAE